MFCPFERQLCVGIIVYHFRDAIKHSTGLIQSVSVVFCLSHYDVDTPLTSPGGRKEDTSERASVHPARFPLAEQVSSFLHCCTHTGENSAH